jgi:hypothetical protein
VNKSLLKANSSNVPNRRGLSQRISEAPIFTKRHIAELSLSGPLIPTINTVITLVATPNRHAQTRKKQILQMWVFP